jgi:hypothetical protein
MLRPTLVGGIALWPYDLMKGRELHVARCFAEKATSALDREHIRWIGNDLIVSCGRHRAILRGRRDQAACSDRRQWRKQYAFEFSSCLERERIKLRARPKINRRREDERITTELGQQIRRPPPRTLSTSELQKDRNELARLSRFEKSKERLIII